MKLCFLQATQADNLSTWNHQLTMEDSLWRDYFLQLLEKWAMHMNKLDSEEIKDL